MIAPRPQRCVCCRAESRGVAVDDVIRVCDACGGEWLSSIAARIAENRELVTRWLNASGLDGIVARVPVRCLVRYDVMARLRPQCVTPLAWVQRDAAVTFWTYLGTLWGTGRHGRCRRARGGRLSRTCAAVDGGCAS